MEKYDVSITECRSYDFTAVRAAVLAAAEAVGGFGFVKPGMTVAMKVNLVSGEKPDKAATTHPAVVCAVCDILRELGASVIVGDSPGGLYNQVAVGRIYNLTGMHECEKYGATLNTDFSEGQAEYPGARAAHEFLYTAYLDKADAVINLCKLKTHGMMGLSCASKNMFGTVPGIVKPEYHFRYPSYERFADMILDLGEYFHPELTICDAVIGMEGNGPTAGTPRPIGAILASRSMPMLDAVAASVIGLTPEDVPTLLAARNRGSLPENISDISIFGSVDDFKISDYKNIATRHSLHFRGTSDNVIRNIFAGVTAGLLSAKPGLDKKKCVGCNKCGSICPASAIRMVRGKAKINRKKCIRCFCCQEFCPKGAMKVRRTLVSRIIGGSARGENLTK